MTPAISFRRRDSSTHSINQKLDGDQMSKLLRGMAAGYGARKMTGGCGCSGIIVFIILWWILGHFGIFK
jgi:hypothetical protein